MGMFINQDITVSSDFTEAVRKSLNPRKQVLAEIHVEGYGNCSPENCVREADVSRKEAERFASSGNHGGAAYHLKRAAMFHEAMGKHLEEKKVNEAQSDVTRSPIAAGDESPEEFVEKRVTDQQARKTSARLGDKAHIAAEVQDTAEPNDAPTMPDQANEECKEPVEGRVAMKLARQRRRGRNQSEKRKERGEGKWQ